MKQKLKRYLFEGEVLRLMSLTVLVKPLGMITQMLIAKYYGAGAHYDAYILTLFLVSFADFTIGRIFTAVAVPFTIKLKAELSHRGLMAYQNWAYLVFLVPASAYVILLIVRGDIPLGMASMNAPTETLDLAKHMVRWMAISGLMLVSITMFKATLNLNKRFRVPALMPFYNSVSMIVILVFLHDRMGIWALPFAFTVSCFLQLVTLVAYALGQRYAAPVWPKMPAGAGKKMWSLSRLIFFSTVFLTMNAFLDKMFASSLVAGSISSIAYSNTIMNFGTQIFTLSLMTVMFTRMSEMISAGDMASCSDYVADNFRRVARIVVPGALALSLTSHEIITVLYHRGAFTASDVDRTAATFAMYMLGLPAIIFNSVIARIFHSLQRMRDKVWLSMQFLVTNTVGNMMLIGPLKVVGLAISSSFAINTHLALSMLVLSRYRTGLKIDSYARTMIHSYLVGFVTWAVYRSFGIGRWFDEIARGKSRWEMLLSGAGRGIVIFALFFIVVQIWRQVDRRSEDWRPRS